MTEYQATKYFMDRARMKSDELRWYNIYGHLEVLSKIPWYKSVDTVIEDNGTNPLHFLKELNLVGRIKLEPGEPKKGLFLARLYDSKICSKILTWLIEVFPEV